MSAEQIQQAITQAEALYKAGRTDEAIGVYRGVIATEPAHAQALNNLGNALKDSGQSSAAADCYRRAIAARPDVAQLHYNLATALADLSVFDEAIREFQTCLDSLPNFAPAHRNLGGALRSVGRRDEGIQHLRLAGATSDLLYASHFLPTDDPAALLREHRAWGAAFEHALSLVNGPRRDMGRMRIGYVSPDFREHPVGRFMLPILEGHDRDQFEIFCYTDVHFEDEITQRSRQCADGWRNTSTLTDEQLALTVHADKIDLLIDLTMHMRGSRLGSFARRPAPVQATYLAYCSTTGLPQMDYRISDPRLDPADADQSAYYTEKTLCLPKTYWCYPEPGFDVVPRRQGKAVTFGCLNSFTKVTEPMLRAWGRLLREVRGSNLILHCPAGSHRRRVVELLGVAADRVRMEAFMPFDRYLALQGQIDIALDPFPYGGGTTTCDALWSGTPVVSLRGRTAVSRGGFSILSNVGLPELVAENLDEYIRTAQELALDRTRLTALQAETRERLRQSALMDRKQFVVDFESLLRAMNAI